MKINTQWNLSQLLPNDSESNLKKEREEIEKNISKFYKKWKDRDDYLSDSKILKEALSHFEKIIRDHGSGGAQSYYFSLKLAKDQNNSKLKAINKKISEFEDKMRDKIRFFNLSLMKISKGNQTKFLKDVSLAPYRNYLKKLFSFSKYALSEPEERILNLKAGPAYSNWVSMRSSFLSKEEREVLTEEGKKENKSFSDIMSLINSTDKKVRDTAAKAFNDILESNVDVAEVEFNSVLENKKINDELRGYDRPDLSRFLSDNIEPEVVDSLVESVTDNFNISRDYYKLKAKLLGVEKLEYHERSVPVSFTEKSKKYSFEDSCKLLRKVLSNLDNEFVDIFDNFLEKGCIDVYPKKGKRDGAFCAYNKLNHPVYILLNHTDELKDVLTLAHEVGHGINDELMRKAQNSLNFRTPISTAEVASTFFEDFVLQELLKEADEKVRLTLIMQKLNGEISIIYRQVAATNFERELHQEFRKKGYLSKSEIGELFKKHMVSYMGDSILQSEGSENWWVYWPHLRNYFYNYSYASGLLISKTLQSKVKENPEFIKEVKKFLSAGGSASPKEIFKKLGVDITNKSFWNEGIKEASKLIKDVEKSIK